MTPKFSLGVLMLCLSLILAGCNGAVIQVHAAQAVVGESAMSKKSVEIYNCDQQTDLHRPLSEEAQVTCTLTISDIATSTSTSDTLELSDELKAELTARIESAYRKHVDEAKKQVEAVDLFVPVGKIRMYDIFWRQETYSSTVSFKADSDTYTAAYTYTVNIPDAVVNTEISCTG